MDVESQVRDIPVGDIQSVDWLTQRAHAGLNALQISDLQESLQPFNTPKTGIGPAPRPGQGLVIGGPKPIPATIHDDLEASLARIPLGQLAPIRLMRFPYEIPHLQPYGLVFGLRRLSAAKAAGIKVIQAQVVTMTAAEYNDHSCRFRLMLMAFCENTHRLALKEGDYIRNLKALKACYHAIHPLASRSTTPVRGAQGRIVGNAPKPATERSFVSEMAEHEGVTERAIRKKLFLAEHVVDDALDLLSDGVITQTAALALAKAPPEQQIPILNAIAQQGLPFTSDTITQVVASHSRPAPHDRPSTNGNRTANGNGHHNVHQLLDTVPDLTLFKYVTRQAINLKKEHVWTPEAASQAIDTIAVAAVALERLEDHVREFANQAYAAAQDTR